MLELRYVRSPFGVAVTPDGRLRHALVARLSDLARLKSLGTRAAFVAWGYDLTMAREQRLGVVHDGTNLLGELPYEQFRVIISAESDSLAPVRRGRIALRATSPNALLLAHRDAMAPMMSSSAIVAAGSDSNASGRAVDEHAGHSGHNADPRVSGAGAVWTMPPADPRLSAFPMAHNPPSTAPFLPNTGERPVAAARPREVITLNAGDTLRLEAGFVRRTIGTKQFVMYGYNGQYPGPLIRVRQGGEIVVLFHNAIDLPSTVHWHGIRLDNASDGVPHFTQEPVAPGDSFTYHVRFPDAGVYWYHPHVREDIQQELGLYGNILVARRAGERVPVNREEILALDDVLLGDAGVHPFGADTTTHALMGRFGNVMLVNGEPSYSLSVQRGEVVRFYLTNVANARTFNLRFQGARVKLIGSDVGDFEREEWVESVVIAPAERYIVETRFDNAGSFALTNNVQWFDHMRGTVMPVGDTLGTIQVATQPVTPDHAASFARA
ncbi:MAG: multicopper oxidase domain-containing protein, partial [Gemmatimonadaceae bacterium]